MEIQEAIDILTAYQDGKTIQFFDTKDDKFVDYPSERPAWSLLKDFTLIQKWRVKPKVIYALVIQGVDGQELVYGGAITLIPWAKDRPIKDYESKYWKAIKIVEIEV